MPPKVKVSNTIDTIELSPLHPDVLKGTVFGSMEWKRSIGGIKTPRPDKAFQIKAERVQEELDQKTGQWVRIPSPSPSPSPSPVQVALSETETTQKVIFSIEAGRAWKGLFIAVSWAAGTVWEYPEVPPAPGQPEFVFNSNSYSRQNLPGEGPWTIEPFRIELRRVL
jgi:hypothetical protein